MKLLCFYRFTGRVSEHDSRVRAHRRCRGCTHPGHGGEESIGSTARLLELGGSLVSDHRHAQIEIPILSLRIQVSNTRKARAQHKDLTDLPNRSYLNCRFRARNNLCAGAVVSKETVTRIAWTAARLLSLASLL